MGDQGVCERRIEAIMKLQKKVGGPVGVRVDVYEELKLRKCKKKVGGGGGSGSGRGVRVYVYIELKLL